MPLCISASTAAELANKGHPEDLIDCCPQSCQSTTAFQEFANLNDTLNELAVPRKVLLGYGADLVDGAKKM